MIESRGLEPLKDIMSEAGGWPVTVGENWDNTSWSWQEADRVFRKRGFNVDPLIAVSVYFDLSNTSRRIICVKC